MEYIIREANSKDVESLSLLMSELSGKTITKEMMLNRLEMIRASQTDRLFVYVEEENVQGAVGFRIRESMEDISRYGEITVIVVGKHLKERNWKKTNGLHRGVGKEKRLYWYMVS